MLKHLVLIGLLSLPAGIPQDQSDTKEQFIRITKFVQNPPKETQPHQNKVDDNQKIIELLKKYPMVRNATGSIVLQQQQNWNERIVDAQLLEKFPINIHESDASKYRILSSPVPGEFRSAMPVNKPKMDIYPKVIIDLHD